VREWGDEIVFLHRIENGGTDCSYGLHVARLAGLPKPVLERAQAVLHELEDEGDEVRNKLLASRQPQRKGPRQKDLFAPPPHPVVDELRKLDVDGLTPRQALDALAKLKERAEGGG